MWSGPRNISTAMMRSWGNRADTVVVDEPFYAHYLLQTGADHPGREEVIRRHESDWQRVAAQLTGPVPGGREIYYQKHMAHHLLDHMHGDWIERLQHVFLIRDPARMLLSLDRVLAAPRLRDTGLPQQLALVQAVERNHNETALVVDARDILEQPQAMLRRLCAALAVPFDDAMLRWPAGPRDTDGVWAKHWYASVEASTGFAKWQAAGKSLPARLEPLLAECLPLYAALHERCLRP